MMDCQTFLDETSSNIKIEAETDAVFFGLNNSILGATANVPLLPTPATLNSDNGMELKDSCIANPESFMQDLDFDLLNELALPSDFSILDDILMSDDSSSNSHPSSSPDHVYDSIVDSPPLTPPSPTSSTISSSSQFGIEVKLEPQSPAPNVQQVVCTTSIDDLKQVIPALAKSGRGRSASHEAPEVQALKRHIRMIRNRESACLSRKKKKDYVTGIESRVQELEFENLQLKHENSILKKRLLELGQVVSGPPPPTIPVAKSKATNQGIGRVKVNKSNNLSSVAARIAILSFFGFLFISFRRPTNSPDFSPTTNATLSKIIIDSERVVPRAFFSPATGGPSPTHGGDHNEHVPTFISKKQAKGLWEEQHAERPFIKSYDDIVNNTNNKNMSTNIRHLKLTHMTGSKLRNTSAEEYSDMSTYHNVTVLNEHCPVFNQTEAIRVQNRLKGIFGKPPSKQKKPLMKPYVYALGLESKSNENKGLTVYDDSMRQYSNIFDTLERREDTYYVISFARENQLLFPAKAHNVTTRPKMSFVIPWRNETHGGQEELIQVDCEVTGVLTLNKPKKRKFKPRN